MEPFYVPLGPGEDGAQRFRSTSSTSGPWDPRHQHGGPPSALLARAALQASEHPGLVPVRVTVELLGPVPVDEVELRARLVRGGRAVELVEAELHAGGRLAATCRVWSVTPAHGETVPPRDPRPAALADGEEQQPPEGWHRGYLSAVEWRWTRGAFGRPGPAQVWTRLRVPLVEGEETSPLARVLAVADSGSGVSGERDLRDWLFINPELTVHLHRLPRGEWVCLDAVTAISAGGAGLATSVLSDEDGPLARGAQALLVRAR